MRRHIRRRAVQHDEPDRRDLLRLARAIDAFHLDDVGRLAQPGGIDQRHREAVEIDLLRQQIARRPRNRGHDRARAADERVEQA